MDRSVVGIVPMALLLSACATVTSEQRAYYDGHAQQVSGQPVAVIADSCFIRDEVGDDLILRRPSDRFGPRVADAIAKDLQQRGQRVTIVDTPFVCGFVGSKSKITLIADDKDSTRASTQFPILRDSSALRDPALSEALLALIGQAVESTPTAAQRKGPASEPLKMDSEQREQLRRALDTDHVWVVHYGGVELSAGKQVGTAVLTGILSLGVSGGTFYSVSMLTDGTGYNVALVDLSGGNIIWKKREPAFIASEGDLPTDWAALALDPFYPNTGDSAGVATAGAVAPAAPATAAQPASTAIATTPAPVTSPAEVAVASPPVSVPVAAPPAAVAPPRIAAPIAAPVTMAPAATRFPRPVLLSQAAPLYGAPTLSAAITRTLAAGSQVEATGTIRNSAGAWLFIRIGDVQGWILEAPSVAGPSTAAAMPGR